MIYLSTSICSSCFSLSISVSSSNLSSLVFESFSLLLEFFILQSSSYVCHLSSPWASHMVLTLPVNALGISVPLFVLSEHCKTQTEMHTHFPSSSALFWFSISMRMKWLITMFAERGSQVDTFFRMKGHALYVMKEMEVFCGYLEKCYKYWILKSNNGSIKRILRKTAVPNHSSHEVK